MKTKLVLMLSVMVVIGWGCSHNKYKMVENKKTGRHLASLGQVDSSYFKVLKIKTNKPKMKEDFDVPVFLPGHASKIVTDKINARIKKEMNEWGCSDDFEGGEESYGSDYSTNLVVSAAYSKVFSFYYYGNFMCSGGAHPSGYIASLNFDLKTGNEIDIKSQFKNYERDSAKISKVFIEEYGAVTGNQDCVEAFQESLANGGGFNLSFAIAESGLVASPEVPHVLEYCLAPSSIRYSKLKPFLKSNSFLSKLIN